MTEFAIFLMLVEGYILGVEAVHLFGKKNVAVLQAL